MFCIDPDPSAFEKPSARKGAMRCATSNLQNFFWLCFFHGLDQCRPYHRSSAELPERSLVGAGAPLSPVLPPGVRVPSPATETGAEGNAHELKLRDHRTARRLGMGQSNFIWFY